MPETSRLLKLVDVARDDAPDARRALLRGIVDVLISPSYPFSATELQHFDVIVSRLCAHADAASRRDVAEKLADAASAPRGLVNRLARDEITVAEPVLRRSKALSEDDLADIIRRCSQAHLRAIARRRDAPPSLAAALIECGDEDTLICLAKNQSVRFSPAGLQAMADKARRMPALQEPLTARYDLPPQMLTHLFFFVAPVLKREILKRADRLEPSLVDAAIAANRRQLLGQARCEANRDMVMLAEQIEAGTVREPLLKTLAAERRHGPFQYAFAHYLGVDLASAQAILKDRRFESLALACRAASLGQQTFAKIVFSTLKEDDDKARALRILDFYVKVPLEPAEQMMRFWRMRTNAEAVRNAARGGDDDDGPLELRNRAKGW